METEFITPAQAKKYFEMNDPDNRPIDLAKVKEYKNEMEAGKWMLKDPIGFSYYYKYLMNGQHRMFALSQANVSGIKFRIERNG